MGGLNENAGVLAISQTSIRRSSFSYSTRWHKLDHTHISWWLITPFPDLIQLVTHLITSLNTSCIYKTTVGDRVMSSTDLPLAHMPRSCTHLAWTSVTIPEKCWCQLSYSKLDLTLGHKQDKGSPASPAFHGLDLADTARAPHTSAPRTRDRSARRVFVN